MMVMEIAGALAIVVWTVYLFVRGPFIREMVGIHLTNILALAPRFDALVLSGAATEEQVRPWRKMAVDIGSLPPELVPSLGVVVLRAAALIRTRASKQPKMRTSPTTHATLPIIVDLGTELYNVYHYRSLALWLLLKGATGLLAVVGIGLAGGARTVEFLVDIVRPPAGESMTPAVG